jgi:predicted transcriptional regulator
MSKQKIHIGIEEANAGFKRFSEAWKSAENKSSDEPEVHLNFENLEDLARLLTTKRLELLRTLRREGPLSVKALAKILNRDYKNVHTDTAMLEQAELIQRNEEGQIHSPWDVIDAQVRLVA